MDGSRRSIPAWLDRSGRASWAIVGIVAAVAVGVLAVTYLSNVVIPLVVASFLAVVLIPLVDWLAGHKVPRAAGAAIVLLGVILLFVGSLAIVGYGIFDQSDELAAQFDAAQAELSELVSDWDVEQYIDDLRSSGSGGFTEGLGGRVGTAVGSVAGFFSGLAIGVVLLYYLLKDGKQLALGATRAFRPNQADTILRIIASSVASVRAYMRGRTILALVQGVAVGLAVWVVGIPLALAIAVVTFITAYIPYIGAFIGGVFAVAMGLAEGGLTLAIVALVIVLFVNVVLENALEPYLAGSVLNLHPVVVLLATVIGGIVAGIVGFILASPTVAISINLYRELRQSGFFDDGDGDVSEHQPADA